MRFTLAGISAVLLLTAASSEGKEADSFATAFGPYLDDHMLAGAVCLVATRDKILDEEAVGFADLANKRPMRADGEFWIASDTKPMTATALMMLVEEGKVQLDDPVEKYLPEFKGQLVKNPGGGPPVPCDHSMLIRELLNHTSGLPFASPLEHPTGDGIPLAERVRGYSQLVLKSQPGAKFSYSSAGFNTVGRIIEVVSGMPYEKFMQDRLFTPLGMKETTFWPHGAQLEKLATTYQAVDKGIAPTLIGRLKYPLDGRDRFPMPAGGLFSTADDVLKFGRMILGGGAYQGRRYVSEASIRIMTTSHIPEGTYGYGWAVSGEKFYHDGADNTRLTIDPKLGVIDIFLVQFSGGWPEGVPDMKMVFSQAADQVAMRGRAKGL
jgi:CubicO group peptidase (beta-lactamase class C family)